MNTSTIGKTETEFKAQFGFLKSATNKDVSWLRNYLKGYGILVDGSFISDILTALYQKHIPTSESWEIIIQKMKKAYQMKIYRESSAKKDLIGTTLPKECIKKIDMFSKSHNIKKNKAIELLLSDNFNKWLDGENELKLAKQKDKNLLSMKKEMRQSKKLIGIEALQKKEIEKLRKTIEHQNKAIETLKNETDFLFETLTLLIPEKAEISIEEFINIQRRYNKCLRSIQSNEK